MLAGLLEGPLAKISDGLVGREEDVREMEEEEQEQEEEEEGERRRALERRFLMAMMRN